MDFVSVCNQKFPPRQTIPLHGIQQPHAGLEASDALFGKYERSA